MESVRRGRTRTVFIGSGGFGVEALQRLAGISSIDIVGVVTAPPKPAGRSGALMPTPIAHEARLLFLREGTRVLRKGNRAVNMGCAANRGAQQGCAGYFA